MSIEQLDKIDAISTTPSDEVVLTISDHLKWNNTEHIKLLQDKINAYLDFIESGQLLESYPTAENKKIIISLAVKYKPNKDALIVLNKCIDLIAQEGFGFEWENIKL